MAHGSSGVYVIAEIANAHEGSLETLFQLLNSASAAGAQAIKVQWFKYDSLATPDYEWYKAYKELYFDPSAWRQALDKAKALGLDIWADVFDDWGLELAKAQRNALAGVKLPPTVLEDDRLAAAILDLGLPTLVGIGGWTEEQIAERYTVLRRMARNDLVLMHGFQGYPTSLHDCNLARIQHYVTRYKCRIGIADHVDAESRDAVELPAYAVFSGATVVEKHLTLSRSAKGYDYYSALEPTEFGEMIRRVRSAEIILGGMERSDNERNYLTAVPRAVMKSGKSEGVPLNSLQDVIFRRTSESRALTPRELRNHLPAITNRTLLAGEPITAGDIRRPRVAIAVICRLKSTRLKRKALAEIAGEPSALRCLRRCTQAKLADDVFLATSDLPDDNDLATLSERAGVKLHRGDPESVLNRLLQVANASGADIVVRVTGDCPVISPEVLDYLIARHLAKDADYTALSGAFPVGIAGDVFSVSALKRLQNSAADLSFTEYLTYYFRWNAKVFRCELPGSPKRWSRPYRLTLDVEEDLLMFRKLYSELESLGMGDSIAELLDLLDKNPEIVSINSHVSLVYKSDKDLIAKIRSAARKGSIQPRIP